MAEHLVAGGLRGDAPVEEVERPGGADRRVQALGEVADEHPFEQRGDVLPLLQPLEERLGDLARLAFLFRRELLARVALGEARARRGVRRAEAADEQQCDESAYFHGSLNLMPRAAQKR